MGDVVYPFRSGAVVSRTEIKKAREAAYSAAACLSIAEAFEGYSDQRRDDALEDALTNLALACRALDRAVPKPPAFTAADAFAIASAPFAEEPA
ncbi:MAG: hypothetical protein IOB84_07900 [Brevundimonas sp.]|nr:hypothetical protein [Brevundimonas sp.]